MPQLKYRIDQYNSWKIIGQFCEDLILLNGEC